MKIDKSLLPPTADLIESLDGKFYRIIKDRLSGKESQFCMKHDCWSHTWIRIDKIKDRSDYHTYRSCQDPSLVMEDMFSYYFNEIADRRPIISKNADNQVTIHTGRLSYNIYFLCRKIGWKFLWFIPAIFAIGLVHSMYQAMQQKRYLDQFEIACRSMVGNIMYDIHDPYTPICWFKEGQLEHLKTVIYPNSLTPNMAQGKGFSTGGIQ